MLSASRPNRPTKNGEVSRDLLIVENVKWSDQTLKDLEERKKVFNVMQAGNFTEYPIQGSEFPEVAREPGDDHTR